MQSFSGAVVAARGRSARCTVVQVQSTCAELCRGCCVRGAECRVVLAVLSGGEVHQRMCRGHSEVGQRLRGADEVQIMCSGASTPVQRGAE